MSYHRTPSLVRRGGRTYGPLMVGPRGSLGGILDDARKAISADATQVALSKACDPVGQAAQAPYDAQLAQVMATWKSRDDFYYVQDMQDVISAAYAVITQSQNLLDNFKEAGIFSSTPQNALFDAGRAGQDYVDALNKAKLANASVVDAPGFRGWVVDVWSAAGEVAYLIGYARCVKPTIVSVVQAVVGTYMAALDAFVAVVKKVAIVAYRAGALVYHAATGALDLMAWLLKYGPIVAAGFGGVWLISMLRNR